MGVDTAWGVRTALVCSQDNVSQLVAPGRGSRALWRGSRALSPKLVGQNNGRGFGRAGRVVEQVLPQPVLEFGSGGAFVPPLPGLSIAPWLT